MTFIVFIPALDNEFVNYDDADYVTKNPKVLAGISAAGIEWAVTTNYNYNWHPLTWLSLQLDATLWRQSPRGFHLTNLLIHAANAALLFCALRVLTGAFWPCIAVALLFAVHPLRVESVAWVAERKDVLSTFFALLALWAYGLYAVRPTIGRYAAVAIAFALSLLSKPMFVTLPCLLLLLDWWPLQRAQNSISWRRLAIEKLPLLALTVVSCVVTYRVQAAQGAVTGLEQFTPSARLANSALSYVAYLSKTFWPTRLAVFYPHPANYAAESGGLAPAAVAAATILLIAVSTGALVLRRRAPYLIVGWLWFLGMLVPTIGLLQVGSQAYADRYTYFPQVGLLLALCWGAFDLADSRTAFVLASLGAVAVALAAVTQQQLHVWHDSLTLWDHALAVTRANPMALFCRGEALLDMGRFEESAKCNREALALDPTFFRARNNLGLYFLRQHRPNEAAQEFEKVCSQSPTYVLGHLNLGLALLDMGELEGAEQQFADAVRLAPARAEGYFYLAKVQALRGDASRGDPAQAVENFRTALRLEPALLPSYVEVADTLFRQGKVETAVVHARAAVEYEPHFGPGQLVLGMVLEKHGDSAEALQHYEEAVRYSPEMAAAWYSLGMAKARQGRISDAADCLARAVERDPAVVPFRAAFASVLDRLAYSRAVEGRFAMAVDLSGKAREQAIRAGLPELAKQIDGRVGHYQRGEAGPPPGAP